MTEPEYWRTQRLGQERRGYPVVGVSWYEARAFCRWLTDVLRRAREGDSDLSGEDQALVKDLVAVGTAEVLLPTETEWEALSGGVENKDRYPWDPPGVATKDEKTVLARANTGEAGLGGTAPVAMYPLGASQPFALMDMAGNVWEWTASEWSPGDPDRVLRGGSWYDYRYYARCSHRSRDGPDLSLDCIGFRCVSPVSGSDS